MGTVLCLQLSVGSSVLVIPPEEEGSEVQRITSLVPAWQLEKSWPWAPLAWDGDANAREDVSLPGVMLGPRTLQGPEEGSVRGSNGKDGEITKGLRVAEGWSDRRNTRGPKASSKSYLDQQSHQPLN